MYEWENSLPKEREAQERFKLQEQRLIDEEIEHRRRKLEIERKGLEEEEFLRLEADYKRKKRRGRSNSPWSTKSGWTTTWNLSKYNKRELSKRKIENSASNWNKNKNDPSSLKHKQGDESIEERERGNALALFEERLAEEKTIGRWKFNESSPLLTLLLIASLVKMIFLTAPSNDRMAKFS